MPMQETYSQGYFRQHYFSEGDTIGSSPKERQWFENDGGGSYPFSADGGFGKAMVDHAGGKAVGEGPGADGRRLPFVGGGASEQPPAHRPGADSSVCKLAEPVCVPWEHGGLPAFLGQVHFLTVSFL